MSTALLITGLLVLGSGPDTSSRITEAQVFAQKGDFASAAELYLRASQDQPGSVDLLYNAGTAALKAGDVGRAILHLERAARLDPADADVLFNLERAREQVGGPLGAAARLPWPGERVLRNSAYRWQTLAMVGLLFALACALARLFTANASRIRRILLVASLISVLTGLVLAGAATRRDQLLHAHHAVLVGSGAATVHELPDSAAPQIFVIQPGQRLRVVEHRPTYLRIELLNGLQGWIEASRVIELDASSS